MRYFLLVALLFFSAFSQVKAQDDLDGSWDHWIVMGNKLTFTNGSNWRHSHEIQWRANNNWNSLDRVFYETVWSYTPNEKWEIVPDFRISKIGDNGGVEVRPGIGVVRKFYTKPLGKNQVPGQ